MVRDRGFEPLTPSVSRKCSATELTAHPESTPDNCFISSVMPEIISEKPQRRKLILALPLGAALDAHEVPPSSGDAAAPYTRLGHQHSLSRLSALS
jgi:hypothetical protein